jgi:glycosyltransferase involved in cell wall biosynthesis
MPVYNAVHFLQRSLAPLLAMAQRDEILEVIVVDDGSTDRSAVLAEELGCKVLSTGGRLGPGAARNIGAREATGQILWFVDSDVIAHEDAAQLVVEGFDDPEVVAVFGSYDDRPAAENFLSQYKNLIHHFYHHRGRSEASTFWAGCGAVRRSSFLEVGGFDAQRYPWPSIEDIELGYRLRAAEGRILLLPALQGTHLKDWRLLDLLRTEVWRRALPWTRLMLERTGLSDDLNVAVGERFRAALVAALLVGVAVAVWDPKLWWLPVVFTGAVIGGNWELVKFFRRRKSLAFTAAALLFHQGYYTYSSAAFAWAWVEHRWAKLLS